MKKNFKLVLFILTSLLIFVGIVGEMKVQAYDKEGTLIDIDVEGGTDNKFKSGDSVTVKVKLNDVKDLFAASFLYTYDSNFLQVDSVDINDDIQSAGVYEAYKDTAKDGNKARYCFTLLGDRDGLSGTYDFATITGKAKQDGEINVGKDNFNFQLIQKKNNDMVKADYSFRGSNGDVYSIKNITEEDESNEQDNNIDNSKMGSNKKNKSKVKIELVEKASESKKSSPEENEDSDKSEEINEENSEQSVTSSSDKNKDSEDENADSSDSKGNNSVSKDKYIVLSVGAVIIIAVVVIYVYRRKK